MAGYTNMFQMAQTWKMNESHKPKRLSDGQQTVCTHTQTCCTFVIAHSLANTLQKHKQTLKPYIHTHKVLKSHSHILTCTYIHTHASRTQSTASVTSACLGYNHSGNSNYIIERIAVRGTLLITQFFQLLPNSSATH